MATKAEKTARKIIRKLKERKHFDDWWDDIYPETQTEIIEEMALAIERDSRKVENEGP